MTPSERARQIEREEFEAECAAIRQRAYALLAANKPNDQNAARWIKRQEPKSSKKMVKSRKVGVEKAARAHANRAKQYSAFGHTRTLTEWANETGMSRHTIRNRLNIGWSLEDALTRKVQLHSNQSKGATYGA